MASRVCGTLEIKGLTPELDSLVTFFEGEIVGEVGSPGFRTGRFGATEFDDLKHWRRFPAFTRNRLERSLIKPELNLRSAKNKPYVFLRLKERFVVNHRIEAIHGASYAGFYYCCESFALVVQLVPFHEIDQETRLLVRSRLRTVDRPAQLAEPVRPARHLSSLAAAAARTRSSRILSRQSREAGTEPACPNATARRLSHAPAATPVAAAGGGQLACCGRRGFATTATRHVRSTVDGPDAESAGPASANEQRVGFVRSGRPRRGLALFSYVYPRLV